MSSSVRRSGNVCSHFLTLHNKISLISPCLFLMIFHFLFNKYLFSVYNKLDTISKEIANKTVKALEFVGIIFYLATSWEELTHWKRLWFWEGLGAAGEGDNRGWDGWMASLTRWTWVWVNSGSWWWTGRPGMLRFMGSQRVWHDWATELNRTEGAITHTHTPLCIICQVIIILKKI